MPPKASKSKEAPAERPILGRFSSHLKIGIVCSYFDYHVLFAPFHCLDYTGFSSSVLFARTEISLACSFIWNIQWWATDFLFCHLIVYNLVGMHGFLIQDACACFGFAVLLHEITLLIYSFISLWSWLSSLLDGLHLLINLGFDWFNVCFEVLQIDIFFFLLAHDTLYIIFWKTSNVVDVLIIHL